MDIKRYLITSADERTWKFDRPVIFLGEWCLRYDRKHIWSQMDMVVAPPYGITVAERKADYARVCDLREQLVPQICRVLNKVHKTNHSQRFWRILIGDWLVRCVDALFNRIKTLQQCISNYEITGTTVITNEHYDLSAEDSMSAAYAFNDELWNDVLYAYIINTSEAINFPVNTITDISCNRFQLNNNGPKIFSVKEIIRAFLYRVNLLGVRIFGRRNDAFIISPYLPLSIDVKLQLSLGQFPQIWNLGRYHRKKIEGKCDSILRETLCSELSEISNSQDKADKIIAALIFRLMPISYLEGFYKLSSNVNTMMWPKNPKFIFTSNNFDVDDIFKLYAAINSCQFGRPYYIGCHGGGFFSYCENPTNSEIVADKYITWGWNHGLPQHTPAYIFKTAGKKPRQKINNNGALLLIEHPLLARHYTWDLYADHANYFNNQIKFVRLLNRLPKEKLIIRLHSASKKRGWFEEERWGELEPTVKIENGIISIAKLISQSRLVVHGYDSTGLLETLSLNIPTLAILQVGFDQLNELSKSYYQRLVDVGIVHLTPESLAAKVNEVWDGIDQWWLDPAIQQARKDFCDRYAKPCDNPVTVLKEILLSPAG